MMKLEKFYKKYVIPKLQKKLNIKNIMEIPKIHKIVINMGIGEANKNKNLIKNAKKDIEIISGQKSITTKTKKSIAGFKIRENWPIGCKVTLRRKKMYNFLEKLIRITIPRIRDFRGLNIKCFDGHGNYNLGIKEQISFPEINYNEIDKIRGLNITINTTAKNNNIGKNLLLELGFPLKT